MSEDAEKKPARPEPKDGPVAVKKPKPEPEPAPTPADHVILVKAPQQWQVAAVDLSAYVPGDDTLVIGADDRVAVPQDVAAELIKLRDRYGLPYVAAEEN